MGINTVKLVIRQTARFTAPTGEIEISAHRKSFIASSAKPSCGVVEALSHSAKLGLDG